MRSFNIEIALKHVHFQEAKKEKLKNVFKETAHSSSAAMTPVKGTHQKPAKNCALPHLKMLKLP